LATFPPPIPAMKTRNPELMRFAHLEHGKKFIAFVRNEHTLKEFFADANKLDIIISCIGYAFDLDGKILDGEGFTIIHYLPYIIKNEPNYA
jgi:hypothetical protein